jgi:hypothetical protein
LSLILSPPAVPSHIPSRKEGGARVAWTIEAYDGLECIWKGSLPNAFGEAKVVEVLRLLAARHLTENEILAGAKGKDASLDVWRNHESQTITTAGTNPFYVATPGSRKA